MSRRSGVKSRISGVVSLTAKRVTVCACHRMVVQPYTVVVVVMVVVVVVMVVVVVVVMSAAASTLRGLAHDDADW